MIYDQFEKQLSKRFRCFLPEQDSKQKLTKFQRGTILQNQKQCHIYENSINRKAKEFRRALIIFEIF